VDLENLVSIAANLEYAAGLAQDGQVFIWGGGNSTPFQLTGLPTCVAATVESSMVIMLDIDGYVWTWGEDLSTHSDVTSINDSKTPVKIPSLAGVIDITSGDNFSVAVKHDGSIWAWGANSAGQLGDGTTYKRDEPVRVVGL
jgi:alpha-tubulin suppressor-like RCC1 family protein